LECDLTAWWFLFRCGSTIEIPNQPGKTMGNRPGCGVADSEKSSVKLDRLKTVFPKENLLPQQLAESPLQCRGEN
jgi:hypothetical protein